MQVVEIFLSIAVILLSTSAPRWTPLIFGVCALLYSVGIHFIH